MGQGRPVIILSRRPHRSAWISCGNMIDGVTRACFPGATFAQASHEMIGEFCRVLTRASITVLDIEREM